MIRDAGPEDVPSIVDIHCRVFPQDLSTMLGKRFLSRAFYLPLSKSKNNHFYLSEKNGQVLGFLLISNAENFHFSHFFLHAPILTASQLLKCLLCPSMFKMLFGTLFAIKKYKAPDSYQEIQFIAVHPEAQGQKTGSALITRALKDLQKQDIKTCVVKTSAGDENAL